MKFKIVQDKIDVLKLCEYLGIEGTVSGDNLMTFCPVNPDHDNKNTPAFGIKVLGEKRGVWNCYGCGMKGNVIHLVMLMKGVDRDEAERLLAEWFDLEEISLGVSSEELYKMLEAPMVNGDDEQLVIPLPRVSGKKERVIEYLMKKRGYTEIESWDIINYFKMDYCEVGYYSGRIIIPIYDRKGISVAFEADSVEENIEKRKLYPKGSQTRRLLFNDCNVETNKVCIVEGIWDVIRLRSFNIPAVAVFGSSISNYQANELIRKYEEVRLFFDGDKAGRNALEKAQEILHPFVKVGIIFFENQDPDSSKQEQVMEIWET